MGICQSYIESIPFGSDVINKIMIKYKMKFNGCYDALKHEEYDGRDMVHLIPLESKDYVPYIYTSVWRKVLNYKACGQLRQSSGMRGHRRINPITPG